MGRPSEGKVVTEFNRKIKGKQASGAKASRKCGNCREAGHRADHCGDVCMGCQQLQCTRGTKGAKCLQTMKEASKKRLRKT